ncbi:phosphoribosylformylglycinamidine synthase [Venturia canescens]|uniref:phosphoribosylformylglycinamidine synthase n=1 Tax=Venturia canescens TaxID=32260 RepID=UPI001C9BF7C7|nr:phosphoribosylformylglycinamidine synthase [Venturia canescens]XP_043267466.1 phosphoribosylformylglycinamidine synthase [Venturia canescens]
MVIMRFYKKPGLLAGQLNNKLNAICNKANSVNGLDTELCYYVECKEDLTKKEMDMVQWVLTSPLEPRHLENFSVLETIGKNCEESFFIVEVGPRLNFSTAFSSNAVSIFKSVGVDKITRVEAGMRYLVKHRGTMSKETEESIVSVLHDRMTECRYSKPIESFDHGFRPEKWFEVDILKNGRKALEDVNEKLGLAFDNWDLDFYTELFGSKLKRNPTSVECFDLAQSNSEHSRHWFFRGSMIIDGEKKEKTLFDLIIDTQSSSNQNNVIKFKDNSSAIEGFETTVLRPHQSHSASPLRLEKLKKHLIFTAETHNFPTGVAPFSGATTGTGGRIRDIQGVGRGGYYTAGTAGYSVGNLHIPGYDLPWEEKNVLYPDNMASPLDILIEASNGASDYGNKFGEPVISGFARSFGMKCSNGDRREWIKPIMFSGGLGTVDSTMTEKILPEKGMEVIKIGGPVYRIGVGGGSASSVEVQGDNKTELDFGAVQRGDAEMEQKLNRLVRACAEMGDKNPILSIHDQGAGGNGNVLKEIVEPAGAVIFTRNFELGDESISTMELWGAEYQENDAILCRKEDGQLLKKIAKREKCPINFVGTVTGMGKIVLSEEEHCDPTKYLNGTEDRNLRHPVDLELELVLGKMPQKTFHLKRETVMMQPITPWSTLSSRKGLEEALSRVLRLPSVASKRYLTNKVDRCVTGLVAQQQCVGPLHTPLADVAVTAISQFSTVGTATSIGEQPIKGLVNVSAGARMTVTESLTNLVFAKISDLKDVKCSGNWMWAAKLPGEGAALYEACESMCSIMKDYGIAIDGGKDSLSMAARIGKEVVKAPGTLVISSYAPCPDIRLVVTPDLKSPAMGKEGCLLFVDLSNNKSRLGGTALAQVYQQLGDTVPDVNNVEHVKNAFAATQALIGERKILAGHDVSDGGLITCLLEMAFAGISGVDINIGHKSGLPIEILFAEEVGWVLEVDENDRDYVLKTFESFNAPVFPIGKSIGLGLESKVIVSVNNDLLLDSSVLCLMKIWEETSYRLELRQTNVNCANEEYDGLKDRTVPAYNLTFDPDIIPVSRASSSFSPQVKVAVIREEGINGDREMAASLAEAGFEVWDVTMQDLCTSEISMDQFRGIIFPGGFSYADVLGSAKGWAATLLFDSRLRNQVDHFLNRQDTFSLGVCNGCQLMSLLGWIGSDLNDQGKTDSQVNIMLDHNQSERFECRWTTVKIEKSAAIMLQGMENSVMGVWVAHGEGRFTFRNNEILEELKKRNCLAIKYTDDLGNPTEKYPLNPNGSVDGIAGICSSNGRHLAMMPHPERCTQTWQWPYIPQNWTNVRSPWQKIFDNAHAWCKATCQTS